MVKIVLTDPSTKWCSIGYRKNMSISKLTLKAGLENIPFAFWKLKFFRWQLAKNISVTKKSKDDGSGNSCSGYAKMDESEQ